MERVDTKFETMPSEFIAFAEKDLQSNFDHRFINALSNAKRALDCQADRLLKLLGYYPESQAKFWGFPKKIALIQEFDIIAPRILNKINRVRNLMEHQYIKPNSEQVEDFIDIVSLFVASTDLYATYTCEVKYMNLSTETNLFSDYGEVEVKIDNSNCRLLVGTYSESTGKDIDFEIPKADPTYVNVLKHHLKKIAIV